MKDLPPIALREPTPPRWVDLVLADFPSFLADHAACELQAAVFALSLVGSYSQVPGLADRLSALAAEELRHFRKVLREVRRAGGTLDIRRRNPYAAAIRAACRPSPEPSRGLDLLLAAALIEARSHERFLLLAPRLGEPRLSRLYAELAEAEERHGPAYVELAAAHAGEAAARGRLEELLDVEAAALRAPSGAGRGTAAVHSAV